jgi:hypothetical protein
MKLANFSDRSRMQIENYNGKHNSGYVASTAGLR